MSTETSAQSIKILTQSNTETDKTPALATNETSSITITRVGLEVNDDKKGNKTFRANIAFIDSSNTLSHDLTVPQSV